MKTLIKLVDGQWIDLSLITGVTRVIQTKNGFHLNLGETGARFSKVLTKKEVKAILKQGNIAIEDFQ